MAVRYGTPQFLLRSTVRLVCNGTDTVPRAYAGGLGVQAPPIGSSTKMYNKEKITFLALLSQFFFAMTWTPTRFKATFETFKSFFWEGGVNLSKTELTNQ